ncbi:MAG: UbiA family prenyltransferase [Phycisphaerae bacterium]|nr:UbiA family prenyltransferase [Phycisphaerae bacterium]
MNATLRAYLELARLSNAPTVVSNTLAGAGCAAFALPGAIPTNRIAIAALASVALYVAGMALNDLFDRAIDATERPHRPIPSGRVTSRGAATFVTLLLLGGLGLLALLGLPSLVAGLALVACIVAYDLIHAATTWSVLIMGVCRGLVYVVGALAIGIPAQPWFVFIPALILTLYVAAFSVVARREAFAHAPSSSSACGVCGYPRMTDRDRCSECGHKFGPVHVLAVKVESGESPPPGATNFFAVLLLSPIVIFGLKGLGDRGGNPHAIALAVGFFCTAALISACTMASSRLVERRPPKIGPAVGLWIATISLYDAYVLFLAHSLAYGCAAVICFGLTRWAQRRIAGT